MNYYEQFDIRTLIENYILDIPLYRERFGHTNTYEDINVNLDDDFKNIIKSHEGELWSIFLKIRQIIIDGIEKRFEELTKFLSIHRPYEKTLYTKIEDLKMKGTQMIEQNAKRNLIPLASDIVSAYVSNNRVEASELPEFIFHIYRSICNLDAGNEFLLRSQKNPAVNIDESIHPNYIVCLEDGLKFKMLKGHLKSSYNITPDQYRKRWGLPDNYPMVAPNYSKKRSTLAKDLGLGNPKKRLSLKLEKEARV